jgi:hypothetical protein
MICGRCGVPIAFGPAENDETLIRPRRLPEAGPIAPPAWAPADGEETLLMPKAIPAASNEASRRAGPVRSAANGGSASTGMRIVRPLLVISALVTVVVIIGGLAAWMYFGGTEPPPAPNASIASAAPVLPPAAAEPAPLPEPPPPSSPPASLAPIADASVTTVAPTGAPFHTLLKSQAQAQPSAGVGEPQAKPERARKRREARLTREAAERQAAALKSAEPPQPPPPSSVKELCAKETSFIGRNGCEARYCQAREWMFSPFCVQRRRLEEQKRQGTFGAGD